MDIFTREIIKDALIAIGEEMFEAMLRTSMSPIIYETTDFAVGLTDPRGNLLAQGNGIVAFLATLDTAVQSTLQHHPNPGDICDGDVFIANTPYEGGGTHLSDVSVVLPVFHEGELIAFTVNKAHWTEIGGKDAGSVSTNSTDVYQEGLQFPFVKLYEGNRVNNALLKMIRANVRLPESTEGDLHACVAAARVGARRILDLIAKYGRDSVTDAMEDLLSYGERMTLAELRKLPAGSYEAEDMLEGDGLGNGPFRIKVRVTITPERVTADFTGTSPQAEGPINCSYTGLVTGARCVFKAITNPDIPANGGSFRPLEVVCPQGTVLSATAPAPVSLYYEALTAAMDTMWKALAPVLPDRLPAGHQRSVNATFISGIHPDCGALYVMGEPLVGGWGAADGRDGDNGQFCCANGETSNIPIEMAETRYAFEVDRYGFHNEEGGAGEYRGGKGVILDYRITGEEAFLTYATSRCEARPWPLAGGEPGATNYAEVLRHDGSRERYTMCTRVRAAKGEVFRLVTASGGGYGDPKRRPLEQVLADLKDGYITAEQASRHYGVDAGGNRLIAAE